MKTLELYGETKIIDTDRPPAKTELLASCMVVKPIFVKKMLQF